MKAFILQLRRHWLGWLTGLVLLSALLLIGLIASGRFDPQPIGRLQATIPLSKQSVAAGQQQVTWLAEALPSAGHSLTLTAAQQAGEQDIGYGLLAGRPESYLGVAVSPLGYVTIWQAIGSGTNAVENQILPWQTWPHVGQGSESNEIWLNINGDEVMVRLNGEWLWQGKVPDLNQQVGLWAESFGQAAVIDFQTLEIFY